MRWATVSQPNLEFPTPALPRPPGRGRTRCRPSSRGLCPRRGASRGRDEVGEMVAHGWMVDSDAGTMARPIAGGALTSAAVDTGAVHGERPLCSSTHSTGHGSPRPCPRWSGVELQSGRSPPSMGQGKCWQRQPAARIFQVRINASVKSLPLARTPPGRSPERSRTCGVLRRWMKFV